MESNKDFKKLSQNPTLRKIALILAITFVTLGLIIFIFNYSYRDKIYPQTYVGDINLGGQTKAQAQTILENEIKASEKNEIVLKYQDKSWIINIADLNLMLNTVDSVDFAWQIGRQGSFKKILVEQLKSIFSGNYNLAVFTINSGKLNNEIIKLSNDIDIPEKDASIKIENLTGVIQKEQTGRKLDINDTNEHILKVLGSFKPPSSLDLKVDETKPKVYVTGAKSAADTATQILKNPITLKSTKKDYTLKPEDIAPWLQFSATPLEQTSSGKIDLQKAGTIQENNNTEWHLVTSVDQDKVLGYLNSIAPDINQEAKDAKFQVENGQVTTFQVSQVGYSLDNDKAKGMIASAITNQTNIVNLPIKAIQPQVASDSASSLGLKELIAEGESSWRGSPANRIHNLTLGSSKISGTIVKPGEEFSTVKTIGQIDGSTGFLPELVIKNSTQVVPEFGGGLCQVSTTLFRAVLNSGLKITAREPHSFRVSYYEPPVGMDATIYDPSPDLKFINTYKTPILIWAIAGSNNLTFQIYGTKDGREVNISAPTVGNFVSPPADVYQESATMEPGTIRQVERALQGCTASFHYSVTAADGSKMENEAFVSKYVALANSYLYGPGYTPPAPDVAPTE